MILRSILVRASGENLRGQQEPLSPLGYSFDIKLPKKKFLKAIWKVIHIWIIEGLPGTHIIYYN